MRLSVTTLVLAAFISAVITLFIYIQEGAVALDDRVIDALFKVFSFWFALVWDFSLLLFLFRGIKHIFNRCYSGYTLELLSCPNEGSVQKIEHIGYGDLVKVWRKWLMLLIWLVGSEMILATVVSKLSFSHDALFDWFHIYVLYAFILIAGYFSFIILSAKCKRVRVVKC